MSTCACVVCKKETQKYKCPACAEPYCSLDCYKQHKDTPECATAKATHEQEKEKKLLQKQKTDKRTFAYTTDDTVDPDKLEELRNSELLRNLLRNPHLRAFLKEVDSAPSAWKAMRAAMQEPLFVEFADECLKIVEPSDDQVDI